MMRCMDCRSQRTCLIRTIGSGMGIGLANPMERVTVGYMFILMALDGFTPRKFALSSQNGRLPDDPHPS